ncbi:dienelactone hydrolase family protein [Opitutales bacterium]|nr:dienelactone hydrolase family protein [Opitutales bacterium]
MIFRKFALTFLTFPLFTSFLSADKKQKLFVDTLPELKTGEAPQTWNDTWKGFDPRAEPLDVEVLKEWEEDNIVLKVLRYRIGVFKGRRAMMAGVYGYPKGGEGLPGLLQIHGGGQYADYKAPLTNAKRGYASLSISWAGRISAPGYRVSPNEVKLFWEGKVEDPRYKITTDWGALDAYHAPSRNGKDAFPSIPVADWTLDPIESPRNNSWFLATLGARRGLTFLERQPEIDADKLGVYGHSMGGKLTVLTAGSDKRVKAAAPSCGGISDRYTANPLHLLTVSDPPSLKEITCPIIFLSPSNDFHGRINDLETSIEEIKSKDWRVTCSPHHNHQDTAEYEVATQLWFDQHLKQSFQLPETPNLKLFLPPGKSPVVTLGVDESREISAIDVFYTQQGQTDGGKDNSNNTKNRFWHHSAVSKHNGKWAAHLQLFSVDKPLWVYANVSYKLKKPISGAGYYYGIYSANRFTLSSLMRVSTSSELKKAGVVATLKQQVLIEDFEGDWQKEWFSYNSKKWGIKTHKLYHPAWEAPKGAKLYFEIKAELPNKMIVGLDSYVTEVALTGNNTWQGVKLSVSDFKNIKMESQNDWSEFKELRFDDVEQQRAKKESGEQPRTFGAPWKGKAPEFRFLRWLL